MKYLLFVFLLIPLGALAETKSLDVYEQTIVYDSIHETDFGTLYYLETQLAASVTDGITIIYDEDQAVLEIHDKDNNGLPESVFKLTGDLVTEQSGTKIDELNKIETPEFDLLIEAESRQSNQGSSATDEDYVGSLERITIPGGGSYTWLLILLIAGAAVIIWRYKNKK